MYTNHGLQREDCSTETPAAYKVICAVSEGVISEVSCSLKRSRDVESRTTAGQRGDSTAANPSGLDILFPPFHETLPHKLTERWCLALMAVMTVDLL